MYIHVGSALKATLKGLCVHVLTYLLKSAGSTTSVEMSASTMEIPGQQNNYSDVCTGVPTYSMHTDAVHVQTFCWFTLKDFECVSVEFIGQCDLCTLSQCL